MKTYAITALSVLLAGCATPGGVGQSVPPAPLQSEVVVKPVLPAYICGDGQRVELDHDVTAGVMRATRGGETIILQEQVGVTPARFVTGTDTVEIEGGTLLLKRGAVARQSCARVPAQPMQGVITGTLNKMDRMALVPGTRAKVLLVDAARADAPSVELASTSIETVGNQVPLHFLIRYAPEKMVPRGMTYRLQARIESPDGRLMFITDTARFVLESEAPQVPVELWLVPVGAPAG